MDIGVNNEGSPHVPLTELDNGYVVPDATLEHLEDRQRADVQHRIDFGVMADELGYDYVFQPEHHFMVLVGNSPDPVLVQTATATRTTDVRLVQMANILPWQDPVRLAERTALLDIVSDGRAEVGIGTGFGTREREVLGQNWGASGNPVQNHVALDEGAELLRAAWTDDAVSFDGHFQTVPPAYTTFDDGQEHVYFDAVASEHDPEEFFSDRGGETTLDAIRVSPRPVQSPHPQLWRPVASATSAEWTARRGFNGCCYCVDFERTASLIDRYHRAAADAGWPDHRPAHDGKPLARGWDSARKRGLAAQVPVFNTDVADEETLARWKRGQEFIITLKKAQAPRNTDEGITASADRMISENDTPIVGDTEHIVERLETFLEVCGYEDAVLVPQFDNIGLTHEDAVDQLVAFAERVVPALEDRRA